MDSKINDAIMEKMEKALASITNINFEYSFY